MAGRTISCPRCETSNEVGDGRVIFCVSCGELIDVRKLESESPSPPALRTPSIVVSTDSTDQDSLPDEWPSLSTNVFPPEEPKTEAHIDVSDLMSELSFDDLELDAEDEDPAEPQPNLIPSVPSTPNQSDAHTEPVSIDGVSRSAASQVDPAGDSIDPNLIDLSEQDDTSPPEELLISDAATETKPNSELQPSAVQPPPLELAEPHNPDVKPDAAPEPEPATLGQNDAADLFADLDDSTSSNLLSEAPPPRTDELPVIPRRPSVPARPVTDAPLEGEDPFAHLNTGSYVPPAANDLDYGSPSETSTAKHGALDLEPQQEPETAPAVQSIESTDNPFDDLAALSAQVKNQENQVRAKTGQSAGIHQPQSVPPPPLPSIPPIDTTAHQPADEAQNALQEVPNPPEIAPVTQQIQTPPDQASHGLMVAFKNAKPKPVERPTTSALPDISEISANEPRPTSSELSLPPKREISSHPDDENLADIVRPVVVIPLTEKGIYEIVHPIAVSMTAAEKRQRVDGKKSLILTGLLLQQAKLLRERLQSQNIDCRIADPSTLTTGINLSAVSPDLNQASNALKKIVSLAVVALIVIGLSVFAYNERQKQQVTDTVRSSMTALSENAQRIRQEKIAKEKAQQAKISQSERTMGHLRHGGRTKQWWVQYIQNLRRKERTATAADRTKIRMFLIDAERKAKALGIATLP